MRPEVLGAFFIILQLGLFSNADLLPFVNPGTSCSNHGRYSTALGFCYCDYSYSGPTCQNPSSFDRCLIGYECYNCQDYNCPSNDQPLLPLNAGFKTVQLCDSATSTSDSNTDETVTITLHSTCKNITSFCFHTCECPSGIAYLGSGCFRTDLINNFGFFILIMAILTLISTLFEFGVSKLERHLKNHNQKALLGIIHTFKSELTLIGLIGLSLYLASSSEAFEHGVVALGGKEDIIEAIHFLIFFLVVGYFFTLATCFVCTKIFLKRKVRKHEQVFQDAREAAFKGEIYDEAKQERIIMNKMNACLTKSYYREYNAYRIYFMNTMKNELSEEDLMFFRYDEYILLCVNDLIGKISGGTWLAWIFFAWNFFVDVYMQNWLVYLNRFLVSVIFVFVNATNSDAKNLIFDWLKKEQANSDPNQSLIEAEQNLPPQPMTRVIIIGNQIMLWFGLTHVFTSGFASKSMSWVILLIGLVIVFMVYGFLVFLSLPTIAGAVYNGSNINKQYVKEVMKRHSQVDKHVLMEQYRSENNGGMPVINDVFIGEYEP